MLDPNTWEDVRGLIALAQAVDDGKISGLDAGNARWFRDLALKLARELPHPSACVLNNPHDAARAIRALVTLFGPDWPNDGSRS